MGELAEWGLWGLVLIGLALLAFGVEWRPPGYGEKPESPWQAEWRPVLRPFLILVGVLLAVGSMVVYFATTNDDPTGYPIVT